MKRLDIIISLLTAYMCSVTALRTNLQVIPHQNQIEDHLSDFDMSANLSLQRSQKL
jgi:hypothetical protein